MRAVTRLTGISEHLLRAWERRYGVVTPSRTEGGTRSYSDADVAHLRMVKHAVDRGQSIGKVARMSRAELAALDDASTGDATSEPLIERVLAADAEGLEHELRVMADWIGPVRWAYEVAGPLSVAIGDGWHDGRISVAQEHLGTACISRVVESILLRLTTERAKAGADEVLPLLILTTPPEELHVIGIQLAALVAAARGFSVSLLGAQTPAEELAAFAGDCGDAIVVVGSVALPPAALQSYLRKLRKQLPRRVPLYAGGADVQRLKLPERVKSLDSLESFEAALESIEKRRHRAATA
jgi:DNA-binding transcriptional MerR regulator/methylmalonyl-CoA mutase cobalamin-binding subunit